MQRLRIEAQASHDGLWIEPDPEGEFVRADEAAEAVGECHRVLRIIRDTLPHINGSVRSVTSLLEEIETVMPARAELR